MERIIRYMIVDVHCHMGLSARRVRPGIERFSFELSGARGRPGYDGYLPACLVKSLIGRVIGGRLGLDARHGPGDSWDDAMERVMERHMLECPSVDRVVVLAFDEYHTRAGEALGPVERRRGCGSSLYASNSLVRHFCAKHPDKLLFGASIHPYRPGALEALEEVKEHAAVLVKWLPLTQNIDAADPRTRAFVRRAGELDLPLLIHYGGEVVLRNQHPAQEDPGPMLQLLVDAYGDGVMPTVIVAHAATPSFPWQRGKFFQKLVDACSGPLAAAPLYADISALYHRAKWLKRLVDDAGLAPLRERLVFGSDFPIIPTTLWLRRRLLPQLEYIREHPSWIEQSYRIMRAVGLDDAVFNRAATILGLG